MRARLLVALVLLLAGCSDAPDRDHRLRFGPCAHVTPDPAVPKGLAYACATLTVPVDHDDPSGDTLEVQVVRVRSSTQHDRIGALVVNFGGPGQSGLDRMQYWPASLSEDVLARFDVVSFDPRGVGRSAPVRCLDDDDEPEPDPDVLTDAGFAAQRAEVEAFVGRCMEALGDRAPAYSTEATARDLDLLRATLGDEQLTYVGYSYGAKLGAEYVHRFPRRVRAAVLDGPSDPTEDVIGVLERQMAGFEASFRDYARACPARPSCTALRTPPGQVLAQLVATAATDPVPTGKPGDDRVAYPSDLLFGTASFLYDDQTWPALDEALSEARDDRDSTAFFEIADSFNPPNDDPEVADTPDALFVINCNDQPPGTPSDAEVRAAARRLRQADPVFGTWAGLHLFQCQYWQPERHPLGVPVAEGSAPVLVVGTVGDPATPYSGAVAMARALRVGHLLTYEGAGHTAYLRDPCTSRHVDTYLLTLVLPAEGLRCSA